MKITSIGEALELEQYVSPAGCERFGTNNTQPRALYARAYGLTLEQMKGYHVHHLCGQGYECLNPDHLVLMTPSDHSRLHRVGKSHSAETKAKMSAAHKGRIVSAETKAKMSAARSGENHPNFGKTRSDVSIARCSLTAKIRWARWMGDMERVAQLQAEYDALK